MHKQAIEIKERLLGPDDYEVALSVGHLASLFNYDVFKYDEAEKLYLRSVKIGMCMASYYHMNGADLFHMAVLMVQAVHCCVCHITVP